MISLALLLLAAQSTTDDEWLLINTSKTGTEVYARIDDLARGNSQSRAARMWIKLDSRKDRTVGWSEMKTMYVVDCMTESYRTVSMRVYFADGSTESVETDNKVDYIVPDSIMASATALLCADGPSRSSSGYRS